MHVRIATPSYSGNPCPQYLDALKSTVEMFRGLGIEVSYSIVPGDMYISHARNELACDFFDGTADVLLMIDDDVQWHPVDALRLVTSGKDFIFGVYRLKTDAPDYPVVVVTDAHGVPTLNEDGLIAAEGGPAGFLCLSRHAVSRVRDSSLSYYYEEFNRDGSNRRKRYDLFRHMAIGGRWWGEDMAFCNLWRAADWKGRGLWCMPDMTLGHVDRRTGHAFVGNYHEYLLARPKPEVAAA